MGYAVCMRRLMLAVPILLLLTSCVSRPAGILVDRGSADVSSAGIGDVRLSWRFDEELVYFELGAPANGWVGIAFDAPSGLGPGAVGGAGIIAGYVADGVTVVRDDYGCESYEHCPDTAVGGSEHLSDVSGEEIPGWTEIRFAIPREASEPYDVSIGPGTSVDVLVGYGFLDRLEDNWFARHRIRITF